MLRLLVRLISFIRCLNEMVETGQKAGQIHIQPDIKPLKMHVKEPPWLPLFPPSAPSILQQKQNKLPEITCDNKQRPLRSCYSLGQTLVWFFSPLSPTRRQSRAGFCVAASTSSIAIRYLMWWFPVAKIAFSSAMRTGPSLLKGKSATVLLTAVLLGSLSDAECMFKHTYSITTFMMLPVLTSRMTVAATSQRRFH